MLYGAGVVGGIVLKILKSENVNVLGFLDDSISKQGDQLKGIDIYPPEKAKELTYDALIIASFRHSEKNFKQSTREKFGEIIRFSNRWGRKYFVKKGGAKLMEEKMHVPLFDLTRQYKKIKKKMSLKI